MYKSGIKQVQRSKGIRMTMDDLEGKMVPITALYYFYKDPYD